MWILLTFVFIGTTAYFWMLQREYKAQMKRWMEVADRYQDAFIEALDDRELEEILNP